MAIIVRLIGSIVLALIILSVPALCALSFAFDWYPGIKVSLIILTMVWILVETASIYSLQEKDGE